MVGLNYMACVISVIAASVYTGYLGDWMVIKLARPNGG